MARADAKCLYLSRDMAIVTLIFMGTNYWSTTKCGCGESAGEGHSLVYLVADHTGFYGCYGWEFQCMVQGDGEPDMTRLYIHR